MVGYLRSTPDLSAYELDDATFGSIWRDAIREKVKRAVAIKILHEKLRLLSMPRLPFVSETIQSGSHGKRT